MRHYFLLILVCMASCQSRFSSTQARFYEDGRQKPAIAVVPVFDHTSPTVAWNLSEEITHGITERLVKKDQLFLTSLKTIRSFIKNLENTKNPFGIDIAWVKPTFVGQDFVVFMELLEHREIPLTNSSKDDPANCAAELNMSLRLRVLDLRGETPQIVLQEILHQQQYLPRQFTKFNFHQVAWGSNGFTISPLGLSHAQLTKEAASRIEGYILLAQK